MVCVSGKTCNIAKDFCQLTISKEAPSTTVGSDPKRYITAQPYYKGAPIASITFDNIPAFKTKVAVTPTYDNGEQGQGIFYLFQHGDSYLSAYLNGGYLLSECESRAEEVMNTFKPL